MDLLTRLPREEDLLECALVMDDAFVYDTGERAQLVAMWRQWLREKCVLTALAEDLDRPPGTRILGFGMGVFVHDEFVREAQSSLPPYLSRQLWQHWQSGHSPVLSRPEIGAANRHDGLNWLSLHVSSANNRTLPAEAGHVRDKMLQVWFQLLGGYQLKSATQEIYGVQHRQAFETFGMCLANDYHDFFAHPDIIAPPPERWPYLFSITRAAALDSNREGTYARALFNYTPPRFAFHAVEQELLLEALSDATDREIAARLCRSAETIKKQWLRIYEKVLSADHKFFADHENNGDDKPTRGPEKKRVLLKYLRRHPEELRPH